MVCDHGGYNRHSTGGCSSKTERSRPTICFLPFPRKSPPGSKVPLDGQHNRHNFLIIRKDRLSRLKKTRYKSQPIVAYPGLHAPAPPPARGFLIMVNGTAFTFSSGESRRLLFSISGTADTRSAGAFPRPGTAPEARSAALRLLDEILGK